MPQITNLKQQVKNKDRVSVFVDRKYSFSLSSWQWAGAGIKVGDEVTEKQVEELKDSSEFGKLHDKALMWLMLRPRSAWELEDYLRRKSENEALRTAVANRLKEKKYIDDQDFAQRWVENRRLLKSVSKLKLKQELIKKRVPKEIIEDTLAADETDELEVLKVLVEKKRKISRYQDDQKLMAYLARQGFRYGAIKEAIEAEKEITT